MTRFAPQTYALLRIVTGLMFAMHGTQKLFGWPPSEHAMPSSAMSTAAGVIELVGGAMIVLGLLARFAAFIASGEMAVAFFMVHASHGVLNPIVNKGEPAVFYCFLFLYIAAAGSGIWSIDALRRRA